jgi:riboflavin synthase
MFTGIVTDVGRVLALEPTAAGDLRLTVGVDRLDLAHTSPGDSIAVAGVCLTVVELKPQHFCADVSQATLAVTTVGRWQCGRRVNLEPALRAGEPLGGHLVAGHVDGVGVIMSRRADARSELLRLRVPQPLERYVARKGSIAVDGVSLTINAVEGSQLDLNLVPHTLAVTTLGELATGDAVNVEVDLIARYVERLAQSFIDAPRPDT